MSAALEEVKARYAHEREFLQVEQEMLPSPSGVFDQHPEYEQAGLLNALSSLSASSSSACPGG